MTSKPRKIVEEQFCNYTSNIDPLWKEVFDRTLIICESKHYRKMCYDTIMKMLYIEHRPIYAIVKVVKSELCARNKNKTITFNENKFYKYKRGIKDIALDEAKKMKII